MPLPESAHTSQPWRIHEIAHDFRLEDVWALPTPGGPDDFPRLVEAFGSFDPGRDSSPPVRFLFALRWKIGDLLKLDEPGAGTGSRVPSLRDRVPADLRDGPAGPDSAPIQDAVPVRRRVGGRDRQPDHARRAAPGLGARRRGWLPRADGRAGQAERPAGHRLHGGDRPVPAPGGLPADAARHRSQAGAPWPRREPAPRPARARRFPAVRHAPGLPATARAARPRDRGRRRGGRAVLAAAGRPGRPSAPRAGPPTSTAWPGGRRPACAGRACRSRASTPRSSNRS